jgi:hypothetical protein
MASHSQSEAALLQLLDAAVVILMQMVMDIYSAILAVDFG